MGQSLHRLGREQANCDGYGMGLVVVSGLIEHRWMGGMTDVAGVYILSHILVSFNTQTESHRANYL